ncbi:MAG TPA: cytidine deaminase [Chitinophagaceae bacterium]
MTEQKYEFNYKVYNNIEELPEDQRWLLNEAREVTEQAYAPYSNFKVGAIARLANGEIVDGTNQENASFPVGLCAERVLLASVSSLYPKVPIETIAISYKSEGHASDHPVSPCGICRQSLQEFESRVNHPIQLILGGMHGPVHVIDTASRLLPLAFTSSELK